MPQVTTLAEEDVLRAATDERVDGDSARFALAADGAAAPGAAVTAPKPVLTPSAITIVKGEPTDIELAALLTVLNAVLADAGPSRATRPPETWGTPAALHRSGAPLSPYAYTARRP